MRGNCKSDRLLKVSQHKFSYTITTFLAIAVVPAILATLAKEDEANYAMS
jgi:hypothetical protein